MPTKRTKKNLWMVTSGFLGLVILPLLIQALRNPLATKFDEIFSSGSALKISTWMIALIALLIALFYCLHQYNTLDRDDDTENKVDQQKLDLIEGLAKRYDRRLVKKMDEELNFRLELTLRYTDKGLPDDHISTYYIDNYRDRVAAAIGPLFTDFSQEIRRLLILGDPGSGKTVLLLQFAVYFLDAAKKNADFPVPVILNLASWRETFDSFEDWLSENLIHAAGEYGTSKKYAKKLVQDDKLLLLLDGLDEVPAEHRASCLQKLTAMVDRKTGTSASWVNYPHVIICSRTTEYEEINAYAPVKAAIHIEPLDKFYVIDKLQELTGQVRPAQTLLFHIRNNAALAEELRTAFSVHLALHLAKDHDFKKVGADELLMAYCEGQLKSVKGWDAQKVERYLHHLAYYLRQTSNIVTFELSEIQPKWLTIQMQPLKGWFQRKHAYRFMLELFRTGLIIGVTLLIAMSIFLFVEDKSLGVSGRLLLSIVFALILGIPLGSLFAIINTAFFKKEVQIEEVLQFRPSAFSAGAFFISFKKIGIRSFWIISSLVTLIGTLVGASSTSLDAAGGMRQGLLYSLAEGWQHRNDGFTLSVLPVYLHIALIFGIVGFSLYYSFFKKKYRSLHDLNEVGIKHQGLFTLLTKLSDFIFRLGLIWYLQAFLLGFCYGLAQGPFFQLFKNFFAGIVIGILFGLMCAIVIGLYNGLLDSLFVVKSSITIYKPYRRFISAFIFKFFKLSFPLTFVTLFISVFVLHNNGFTAGNFGILSGIVIFIQVLCLILCAYTNPLVNNLAIRSMLFFQGKMPLRYRHFLDKVADTGLMEKDGGQWRFRHQLIQDFFTSKAP